MSTAEKGGGGAYFWKDKVTPYLPNKTFSAKSTQHKSSKAYKKLYTASLWTYKPGMQHNNRYTGT